MSFSHPLAAPVRRRTTLVAAPLGLLAGCKWTEEGTESLPEPTEPAVAADDELVADALAAINRTAGLVDRVAQRHIGLSGPLAPLTTLHREHASALEEELAAEQEGPAVPERSRAAASLVVQTEKQLQTRLAGLSAKAASGPLASVLASMAAGVAQHVVALRDGPAMQGGGA